MGESRSVGSAAIAVFLAQDQLLDLVLNAFDHGVVLLIVFFCRYYFVFFDHEAEVLVALPGQQVRVKEEPVQLRGVGAAL